MYISKTSTQIFNKWYLRLSCWGEFEWVAIGGFHWPVVNKIPPPFVASSELRLLPRGFLCHKHPIFVWPFLRIPQPYYMPPAWKLEPPGQAFCESQPTKATYTAQVPLGTLQPVAESLVIKRVDKPWNRMTFRSVSSLAQKFFTQGFRPRNLGSCHYSWIMSLEEG